MKSPDQTTPTVEEPIGLQLQLVTLLEQSGAKLSMSGTTINDLTEFIKADRAKHVKEAVDNVIAIWNVSDDDNVFYGLLANDYPHLSQPINGKEQPEKHVHDNFCLNYGKCSE